MLAWFRQRWKALLRDAALLIAVLVGIQLYQSRGLPDGPPPPLEAINTDGLPVQVGGGTAANRAQLVVFWATWCPVCKAEEGNIEAVAGDWPVVSVAMQSGDAAAVRKHLAERELKLAAVVDDGGQHAETWRVRGVPTHFILDPAGNIRFRLVGYATRWGLQARLWWAQAVPA